MELKALSDALKASDFPVAFPGHWINGTWETDRRADAIEPSVNPCNGALLTKPSLSAHLINQAADAAQDNFSVAAQMPFEERLDVLRRFKQVCADYEELIERALCLELGKPMWEVKSELDFVHQALESVLDSRQTIKASLESGYSFQHSKAQVELKPLGPVIAFIPFSTPFLSFTQAFSSALIAGCPLVAMTSTHASLCSMVFTQIVANLGLPDGFFNSLFGSYKFFVRALQDRRFKAVIYSGSREHCDSIRRDYVSDYSRELILYSGGKNAVIVDESAQVELAVELCLRGVIKTAGQLNSSTSQVFVPRQLLGQFNDALVGRLKKIKIGPEFVQWSSEVEISAQKNVLGPLYSKKALEKFLRFQTMAKREASETLVWGKAIDGGSEGYFVTPGLHVFDRFDASSAYQSNVFMCPDLAIYGYDKVEEAIGSVNTTAAPFIVSLIGEDTERFSHLTSSLDAPNVVFNQATVDISLFDAAAGRNIAGGHRYAGFQIVNLLTYPQLIFKG